MPYEVMLYNFEKEKIRLQKEHELKMKAEIILAVKKGWVERTSLLLDQKPSLLKTRDENGHSLFKIAKDSCYIEVEYLLAQRLVPYYENRDKGYTSLFPESRLLKFIFNKSEKKGKNKLSSDFSDPYGYFKFLFIDCPAREGSEDSPYYYRKNDFKNKKLR